MSDRFSALTIADIYNIPPWLIGSEYNTTKQRWRWRLRWFRRTWLKNKLRYG